MKNILKNKIAKYVASAAMSVGMLLVVVGGNAGVAFASSPSGTLSVNGAGSVVADLNTAFTYTSDSAGINPIQSVMLNGQNQTIYMEMPIKVIDATGTGAGWTVSLHGTPFAGSGHQLAAPIVTSISNLVVGTGSSALNGNTNNAGALGTPTGSALPSTAGNAQMLLSANTSGGYGMGTYTFNVQMSQDIQASDYAESYSTTFNLDVA